MLQIEEFKCNNGNEARTRERYWYELIKPSLNTLYPIRSEKEIKKDYYERNKEIIAEKFKNYYDTNKACFKEYNHKYYTENAEKERQRQKEYRKNNSEKIKQKIECTCGAIITKVCLSKHCKTKAHQDFISSNNINGGTP